MGLVLSAWNRFRESTNMTDRMAALTVLCDHDCPQRSAALEVRAAQAACPSCAG